jgi:hypothetical protein
VFTYEIVFDNIFHLLDFSVMARRNVVQELMELHRVVLPSNLFAEFLMLIKPIIDMNMRCPNMLLKIVHFTINIIKSRQNRNKLFRLLIENFDRYRSNNNNRKTLNQ